MRCERHFWPQRSTDSQAEAVEKVEEKAEAERALDLLLGNNSYAFIDIFQFLNVAARVRHNKF